ncbi:hypothetical protein F2P81_012501 [Scophthalmus maximus]|uniref:cysteine desulfurase n=1 Tax=Scophthalmus maximus TaxID=52904 RepID=A0A6A4SKU8_SCOMX|nr:hypothetical protein F2P81_012501 [Scophthalmus maximus]
METARKQVADLIGADPREIIFTSGATESNNMAIKGVARFYQAKKRHVITTQTEHKCVLDSCRVLESEGFSVTYLPVQTNGLVDLELLEASIRPDTSLVSVMTVNNEIGVTQPIKEIGHICRSKGVFLHTDAAQAVGKIPLNVSTWKIDLMSISGHKIYGPKGVGALYVRRRPRVRMEPLQSGGGQERGLRSGTVPTPLAVGLGAACSIAQQEMEYDHHRVTMLANRLVQKIMAELPDVLMNGHAEQRYPGCVNLSFAYVEGESLLMALKDVALSSGRFGIGRFTTEDEVDYTAEKCIQQVRRLREMREKLYRSDVRETPLTASSRVITRSRRHTTPSLSRCLRRHFVWSRQPAERREREQEKKSDDCVHDPNLSVFVNKKISVRPHRNVVIFA